MNYRILGKAIFKAFAWMIGGGVLVGVAAFGLAVLQDLSKPWGGVIVLSTVCLIILIKYIWDTYKEMVRKETLK